MELKTNKSKRRRKYNTEQRRNIICEQNWLTRKLILMMAARGTHQERNRRTPSMIQAPLDHNKTITMQDKAQSAP